MAIDDHSVLRTAQGCVVAAYPRWKTRGIRITTHPVTLKDPKSQEHHHEWLTVFREDGSVIVREQYPENRTIGFMTSDGVSRLMAEPKHIKGLRGHIRQETRRQK